MELIILMFLCHVLDDFVFQLVCLSKLKQKSEWPKSRLYRNDYLVALLIHAFSWSGWILVPWMIFRDVEGVVLGIIFVINGLIHAFVDHLKCNTYSLNLVWDQSIHILQILITWSALKFLYM